jgi:hypothetical protein
LAKPRLSNEYRAILEEGNYTLQVEVKLKAEVDDEEIRHIAQLLYGSIQLKAWEEGDIEESMQLEIGDVLGWRTLSTEPDTLELWSDGVDHDIYTAFDWLVNRQKKFDPEEVLLHPVLFLDRVTIEPEWRGLGFTIPAVATFLDMVACEFVFLMPSPPDSVKLPTKELKRGQHRLKRYWQKLGINNYDAKYNILWTQLLNNRW